MLFMQKQLSLEEKRVQICQTYLKKTEYLLSRNMLLEEDLYTVLNDFFKEYLALNYSFTHHELKKELEKLFIPNLVKRDITMFLDDLMQARFSSEQKPTQEQIKLFLERFSAVLDALLPEPLQNKKVTPRSKIDDAFIVALAEQIITLNAKHAASTKQQELVVVNAEPAVEKITILIEKTYALLEQKKKVQAKKKYLELIHVYDHLTPTEQSQCYLFIDELYRKLASS
jgi:hypothetical protein